MQLGNVYFIHHRVYMDKTELTLILGTITIIAFVFIAGVLLFIFQYRRRKLVYEIEKAEVEKQHKIELLNTQLQMQQQTMQFIGREIHDSVSQKLTLAAINTQRMEFEAHGTDAGKRLSGISKIINDSLIELRQLSGSLTDELLQHASLEHLVEMECSRVNDSGTCSILFETAILPQINIATKSSLLRIIQEFIQNSLKHSACTVVKIKMTVDSKRLTLLLQDDGKGFELNGSIEKGNGLGNMRRRVQMLNGQYSLTSSSGNGVQLFASILLNNNTA
jgi:signal transduction histidine kinase